MSVDNSMTAYKSCTNTNLSFNVGNVFEFEGNINDKCF